MARGHQVRSLMTLASASLRSELQYRSNALMSIVGGILYQITGFLVMWLVVSRFKQLGGWSLAEMTFLYGMRLTSHGIFYLCFSQLFELDTVVITGEFDRFLTRPVDPLLQMFTRKLRINCFGDLLGGAALLTAASLQSAVSWTPLHVAYLLLAVVGGALVEGAVQITLSSLTFRFLNMTALRAAVNEIFNQYGNYPFSIFPTALRYVLTFALPVAFVAFFPATWLLDRRTSLHVASGLALVAPLVGLTLVTIAWRIWHIAARGYQSAGT